MRPVIPTAFSKEKPGTLARGSEASAPCSKAVRLNGGRGPRFHVGTHTGNGLRVPGCSQQRVGRIVRSSVQSALGAWTSREGRSASGVLTWKGVSRVDEEQTGG